MTCGPSACDRNFVKRKAECVLFTSAIDAALDSVAAPSAGQAMAGIAGVDMGDIGLGGIDDAMGNDLDLDLTRHAAPPGRAGVYPVAPWAGGRVSPRRVGSVTKAQFKEAAARARTELQR